LLLEKSHCMDAQILVRMTEDVGLASLLDRSTVYWGKMVYLKSLGLMEQTCKASLMNDGSHAALASAIHEEFIRDEIQKCKSLETNPSMKPSDQLNEDLREMNRNQADDTDLKFKNINCNIIPWNDYGADQFNISPEEIELLASREHERWCSFRRTQGWKYSQLHNEKKAASKSAGLEG
jgi:hypothetical protein